MLNFTLSSVPKRDVHNTRLVHLAACVSSTFSSVTLITCLIRCLLSLSIKMTKPRRKLIINLFCYRFIGEESTAAGLKCELTNDPTWIIDPVDGTMNFVHGYPNVCVSVALWVNKVAEIGIIYNPVLELFFSARRGQGSFLNGKPIRVSDENG
jgi:hypothetical protein